MPLDRLVISNFATGFETDRTPFLINNDAFPQLYDAYAWRGRILRKRGTSLLGRLKIDLTTQALGNTDGGGAFSGNIFTILGIDVFAPEATVVPGSITVTIGAQVFVEDVPITHNLNNGGAGTGTIIYATGQLDIQTDPVLVATPVTIDFSYYPSLPVLGLEGFDIGTVNDPLLIGFDNLFSYGFDQGLNTFYNVNFYKSTGVAFQWKGADYQQFWTTNYLGITTINDSPDKTGCMWTTNGNPGMHFIKISAAPGSVTIAGADTAGAVATVTTSAPHNLTNNDFVFLNEISGITKSASTPTDFVGPAGVNGQSGQVTVTGATTFTIPAPWSSVGPGTGGIVQYITRSASGNIDGIRWYDGDPNVSTDFGWVNFAPPLTEYNSSTNPLPQYLVGAKMIVPFKNRILFFGVYLRTSATTPGIQFYPNRMVYSQVGSPYYSRPLPFPIEDQQPELEAYFQNLPGRGGFLTSPIDEEIITANTNEDILIVGHETRPLKLISTGDDVLPFIYQTISSEYGAESTFSAVPLDTGTLYIGEYGIALITSTSGQRIDLKIPDQVFEIGKSNNRLDRITSIRDFQKEFIYFTYAAANRPTSSFPNQTLLYNYRDQTWALFDENFTRYGTFRRSTNLTWSALGLKYGTWSNWTDPWNSGINDAFFPQIIGGNQQGFVLEKGVGVAEANAQYISDIVNSTITSPDHCLNTGDFISISGIINLNDLNGTIQQITVIDKDTFTINDESIGVYYGGGVYKRLSRPFIQTKQFPIHWNDGRGSRVGPQRFLFEGNSRNDVLEENFPQLTVNVYVSQNGDTPANDFSTDGYLPYSNIVLTCAEPGNDYSGKQAQIWHRLSNGFSGDTVQMAFTLSDIQMRNPKVNEQEIILHAIVLDLYPGRILG